MKEKIAMALGIIGMAKDFKPVARQGVDALKEFAPELDEVFGGIADWAILRKIKHVKTLEADGFTRKQAMCIVSDTWADMSRATGNAKRKKE